MNKKIPAPIISVLSDHLPNLESHPRIDSLFMHADAPGEPPEGSKPVKVQDWVRRINNEAEQPLKVLGLIIECYMELPDLEEVAQFMFRSVRTDPKKEFKNKLEAVLTRCNLTYISGGVISDGSSAPSRSLGDLIKGRDNPAIDAEFNRALANVNSEPREAVSAACNILESLFKIYISEESLNMPQKQDLQNLWKVVRHHLGFDPKLLQDDDLKKILTGVLSVVDGIGAFRTHASSAHGEGAKIYNIKPRHARLAIHSSHTIALFVLETWDERKNK
ncbi:abortive infection family protein [Marinomonas algicola]|uniref:abortive infection family protein n=1 Tax=Marinomonas algicola TaxID=2773454 RepID=UPI00174DFA8A|nr:abortive infection family protein [Marinomonas algicola]